MLSLLYMLMSIFTCLTMSESIFAGRGFSQDYIVQMYQYAREIEVMKLVHAVMLAAICGFMYFLVRRNRVLTRK